jgi:V8-like Glu-specific endopeptidase
MHLISNRYVILIFSLCLNIMSETQDIIGPVDTRVDLCDPSVTTYQRTLAKSVCAIVTKDCIALQPNGDIRLYVEGTVKECLEKITTFKNVRTTCAHPTVDQSVPFQDQPTGGFLWPLKNQCVFFGTGTLVNVDLVVTNKHIWTNGLREHLLNAKDVAFVFGYYKLSSNDFATIYEEPWLDAPFSLKKTRKYIVIPASRGSVYFAKDVPVPQIKGWKGMEITNEKLWHKNEKGEIVHGSIGTTDYVAFQLTKPVDIKKCPPLRIDRDNYFGNITTCITNSGLCMMGYPFGMPLKVSTINHIGKVTGNSQISDCPYSDGPISDIQNCIMHDGSAGDGSSGSPVFAKNPSVCDENIMLGLHIGGVADFNAGFSFSEDLTKIILNHAKAPLIYCSNITEMNRFQTTFSMEGIPISPADCKGQTGLRKSLAGQDISCPLVDPADPTYAEHYISDFSNIICTPEYDFTKEKDGVYDFGDRTYYPTGDAIPTNNLSDYIKCRTLDISYPIYTFAKCGGKEFNRYFINWDEVDQYNNPIPLEEVMLSNGKITGSHTYARSGTYNVALVQKTADLDPNCIMQYFIAKDFTVNCPIVESTAGAKCGEDMRLIMPFEDLYDPATNTISSKILYMGPMKRRDYCKDYYIEWGDGQWDLFPNRYSNGISYPHTYSMPGKYPVTVTTAYKCGFWKLCYDDCKDVYNGYYTTSDYSPSFNYGAVANLTCIGNSSTISQSQNTSGSLMNLAGISNYTSSTTADNIIFVNSSKIGGFEVNVRLDNISANGGIMVRKSLSPSSPMVYLYYSATGKAIVEYRVTASSPRVFAQSVLSGTKPMYLRIKRYGTLLYAYASQDGKVFSELAKIQFPSGVLFVGLSQAAADGKTGTASFTDYSIKNYDPLSPIINLLLD